MGLFAVLVGCLVELFAEALDEIAGRIETSHFADFGDVESVQTIGRAYVSVHLYANTGFTTVQWAVVVN